MSKRIVLMFACALIALSPPAFADEDRDPNRCPFSAALERDDLTYQEKMGNMLARGALNVGFGWTEVLMQTTIEAKKEGNILAGLFRGIGQGFTRTANGAGELLTFWTPKLGDKYITFATDSPLDMHNDQLRDIPAASSGVATQLISPQSGDIDEPVTH